MSNSIKQIYAGLQIEEKEIKVIVAEYFNTRFNLIRVEKIKTKAISDFKITNFDELVTDIKTLIDNASNKIGARIEKVILVLPTYNFKRFPLTSSVNTTDGYVHKEDVARAITNSLRAKVDNDVMVINPIVIKYNINGISYRRLPEKEVCESMLVDIDLLCADKQMTVDYVTAVEKAGVNVLDVCLNNYAIAIESSLLDESVKKNLILLDIHEDLTYLTLLSKGKLITSELIYEGLNMMANKVYNTYRFNEDVIMRLLKYDVEYESSDDSVIYAWTSNDKSESLSKAQLSEMIAEPLDNYVNKLMSMCKPIIESGECEIIVTGEGEKMSALIKRIKECSGVNVRGYYPDTIGVRDPNLTAIYGSLVAYRIKALLNNLNVSCIDLLEYDKGIDARQLDNEGATITTKIKNFFKYMNKEETK